jgi:glycogen debranching enzyme
MALSDSSSGNSVPSLRRPRSSTVRPTIRGWRVARRVARGRWVERLGAGERRELSVVARPESTGHARPRQAYGWREWQAEASHVSSDDPALQAWLERSGLDLFLLTERLRTGPFPMAGIPWFATPFGRDSILTAMFALPYRRDLALGVLRALARLQGRADAPERDEEPGRIPHEVRQGELVRTGGAFGSPYYGSVDATPLFVWLAAEAARWLPDAGVVEELEPALRAALRWMDERGDLDGDGFIEYRRRAPRGIDNQVWKDSHDSLRDESGNAPPGPIAAVEVQAYAYAAWRSLAAVVARRDAPWARELDERADRMRVRFERAFWLPERGVYAQALDGRKRPIADVTSNVGHVLWTGIASRDHARAAALRLREPDLASGWGIRTRSARSRHYDPGSYHNGAVWPHDTAIAAAGMRHSGLSEAAMATIAELRDAAGAFAGHRLPELFGGERRSGPGPVRYPVACSPQAWTAAAGFLCLRTMLGLELSADGRTVTLDPALPIGADRLEVVGMRVGTGTLDVRIRRRGGRARVTAAVASGIDLHLG